MGFCALAHLTPTTQRGLEGPLAEEKARGFQRVKNLPVAPAGKVLFLPCSRRPPGKGPFLFQSTASRAILKRRNPD